MAWTNEELARCLEEIAALLRLRGGEEFRARAYERAAGSVTAASLDLGTADDEEIAGLRGVGGSIAGKIAEYRDTGRIALLDELREELPAGFEDLLRVPGLGPKTARRLYTELGVDSLAALRTALDDGSVGGLKGFGERLAERLRAAMERVADDGERRVPLSIAAGLADELCARLREVDGVTAVEVAGSYRRGRETVGDLDILVSTHDPAPVASAVRASGVVVEVLAGGEKKVSVRTVRGLQVDVRIVAPEQWGAALLYFTGSKQHNVRLRERAVRDGRTLNEYGLFDRVEGEAHAETPVAAATEEVVYAALDMPWIPPTLREDTGEVEAALAGGLPGVVTVTDLRGDLHGHTNWSGDAVASLEEMIAAAAERGYAYWLVTDHAERLAINGIDRAAMLAQREAIAALQARTPSLRILHGAELNIDLHGGLDYDDEFLLSYDLTVASVHSHFDRPEHEQTARIVAAMEHPAVTIIGHPTGRLVGGRPGYPVDLETVIAAAVRTGTALEVNASPHRLDLRDEWVRRAVEAGAMLAISCDAHRVAELDNMRYGVATAQRGWAPPEQVLNCRDLDGLLTFAAAKREVAGDR